MPNFEAVYIIDYMRTLLIVAILGLSMGMYLDEHLQLNMTVRDFGYNLTIDFLQDGWNATDNKWYGVGFGTQMVNTSMVICSRSNGTPYCSEYIAPAKKAPIEVLPNNVTMFNQTFNDHVEMTFDAAIPYNLSLGTTFPIIWAYGDVVDGMMYHGKNRGVTNITLSSYSENTLERLAKPWKLLPF